MTIPIPLATGPLTIDTVNKLIVATNILVQAAETEDGGGSVTTVSVTTANGVSGTVATATTTPAISLTLGAITPTSVAASGTVTGSNLSGTNTGDQTNITGNAGTATALETARTINGVSFDGTADISTSLDGLTDARNSGQNLVLGHNGNDISLGVNNTFVGEAAGFNLEDGSQNTAIGATALFLNEVGQSNSAVGMDALRNVIATGNTGMGAGTGYTITTGTLNTFLGLSADADSSAATNRIAVGYAATALVNNSAQIGNADITDVYFGDETAILHADGSMLTNLPASGATDLDGLTDAYTNYGTPHNLILGTPSAAALTAGAQFNLFVGELAGATAAASTAATANNTAVGYNSLAALTSGLGNTAVGSQAGTSTTSGNNNTVVGYAALSSLSTGADNTALGLAAGNGISTGTKNTLLGNTADVNSSTAINRTAIGYGAVATADNTFLIGKIGTKQAIKEGANAAMGVATLVAGTVTVSNTLVTANSRIFLTAQSLGTVSVPSGYGVSARNAGADFTILASIVTDTSVIAWEIKEPG